MPAGDTHDQIAVAASPLLAVAGAALAHSLGRPPLAALLDGLLLTASHLACSRWLSPDLDLPSAAIDRHWGVLAPIWRPYERLIPHRHWLSHSGLSALLRLAYLFVALNLLLIGLALLALLQGFVVGLFVADTPTSSMLWRWLRAQYLAIGTAGLALVRDRPAESLAVLAGTFFSDLLHTVSDRVDTARKRRRLGPLRLPQLPLHGLRRRHRRPARRPAQRRLR